MYHILVGSFKIEEYANNFKKSLQKQGYLSAKVFSNEANGDYNVIINSLNSKIDAERFIKKLSDTPYRNAYSITLQGSLQQLTQVQFQTIYTLQKSIQPVAKPSNLKKSSKPKIKSNSSSKDVSTCFSVKDEKDSKYHILVGSFNNEELCK